MAVEGAVLLAVGFLGHPVLAMVQDRAWSEPLSGMATVSTVGPGTSEALLHGVRIPSVLPDLKTGDSIAVTYRVECEAGACHPVVLKEYPAGASRPWHPADTEPQALRGIPRSHRLLTAAALAGIATAVMYLGFEMFGVLTAGGRRSRLIAIFGAVFSLSCLQLALQPSHIQLVHGTSWHTDGGTDGTFSLSGRDVRLNALVSPAAVVPVPNTAVPQPTDFWVANWRIGSRVDSSDVVVLGATPLSSASRPGWTH